MYSSEPQDNWDESKDSAKRTVEEMLTTTDAGVPSAADNSTKEEGAPAKKKSKTKISADEYRAIRSMLLLFLRRAVSTLELIVVCGQRMCRRKRPRHLKRAHTEELLEKSLLRNILTRYCTHQCRGK